MKEVKLLAIVQYKLPRRTVEARYYWRLSSPVEHQVIPILNTIIDTVYASTRQTT